MKVLMLMLAVVCLTSGCSKPQPAAKTKPDPAPAAVKLQTVRGVLRHHPSNVKSVQAWLGHNFMVEGAAIIPTAAVPEETLLKHIGKEVIVTGIWEPGRRWKPAAETVEQVPVFPESAIVNIGDGLKAASIKTVSR